MENHNDRRDLDEILDQDIFEEPCKSYSVAKLVFIFFVSIAVIAGACYIYNKYKTQNYDEVIVISADTEETKVEPIDPGGMVVNNMDKEVYDSIDQSNKKDAEEVETLLPPTEEPVDKKELLPAIEDPKAVEGSKVSEDSKVTEDPKKIEEVTEKSVSTKKVIIEKNEEYIKPVVQEKSKQKKKAEFTKKSENFYKVQIASFKSGSDAKKEWYTLSKRYPKLLGKYKHYIVSKHIEGKGIYQRLQVGPFDSEDAARKACSGFKDVGMNCFIIRP